MPTDESTEAEADMAKMMFLIVKRQWQQHQQQLTALFAVCDHKQNYLNDQVSLNHGSLGGLPQGGADTRPLGLPKDGRQHVWLH